jgi:hypothetical protein
MMKSSKRKEPGESEIGASRESAARQSPGGSWRENTITAKSLRTEKFAPVNFILPELMPEGVTLIVSKPKQGKSWMVLDLCIATTMNRFTLGYLKPAQGDALFLALEDSKRRLQSRLGKLLPSFTGEWPERLTLTTKWSRLHEGGADALREWCKSVERPTLIGIDTLALIRPPGRSSQLAYQADYEALTLLHELTGEFPGLGIGLVHHNRKLEAEDVFDTVSGTQGLVGAADTIWIIKRNPNGTTLHIRGRDVEETEKAIEFNKTTCRWTILGPAAEIHRSNERGRVLTALVEAGESLSVNEIMAAAQLRTRNAADLLLGKMARDGELTRVSRGRYSIPKGAGQIGQTERSNKQHADSVKQTADLSNLSDLSDLSDLSVSHDPPKPDGVNGGVTAASNCKLWADLDIPPFLRRHKFNDGDGQ